MLRGRNPKARAFARAAQRSAQLARRASRIGCFGDRAHDCQPACSGGDHGGRVSRMNTANRKERHGCVRRRVTHQIEACSCPSRLGRSRVNGSDADVVDSEQIVSRSYRRGRVSTGCVDLRGTVRRKPDEQILADDLAGSRDRHIVLTDVDTIGARGTRDRGMVVDDQQSSQLPTQAGRLPCDGLQLVVCERLVAQLHDLHAAGDRGAQHVVQRAPARVGVAYEIQPRSCETSAALIADTRLFVAEIRPFDAEVRASPHRLSLARAG